MTVPQTANMLSVKTSLYYLHPDDDTKYYAAYTGKSGNSSGKLYNKNVKSYSIMYDGEPMDFRNLEIVEIWCKDLSERDWRKLNEEVVEAMCCLLNPAPGQYKIHFFNKKGNQNAQAFTYSTMIFRIILHCENEKGVWQGTLPIRINTRSSALKHVWRKERSKSSRPKKRPRLNHEEQQDHVAGSDGAQQHQMQNPPMQGSGIQQTMNEMQNIQNSIQGTGVQNVQHLQNSMQSGMQQNMPHSHNMQQNMNDNMHDNMHDNMPQHNMEPMLHQQQNSLLNYNTHSNSSMMMHNNSLQIPSYSSRPMPTMISTDDMIIGGGDGNTSGDEDEHVRQRD